VDPTIAFYDSRAAVRREESDEGESSGVNAYKQEARGQHQAQEKSEEDSETQQAQKHGTQLFGVCALESSKQLAWAQRAAGCPGDGESRFVRE
jgi:hypothetical protein